MKKLGKYRDLHLIGEGGSAKVYRATHPQLEVPRALKVFAVGDKAGRERIREALYQARVDHHGIVSIIDVENDPETHLLYLVMEYAPLGSLTERLSKGPMQGDLAARLAAQIAHALAAAHAREVWHLDLKPDNILFFEPQKVKIADFGLARTPADARAGAGLAGTPNYMAPEQADGRPGPASDLWALGVIIYEMLSGRALFPGREPHRVLADVRRGPGDLTALLSREGLAAPRWLVELAQELLSHDPASRPGAAEAARRLSLAGKAAPLGVNTIVEGNRCAKCGVAIPLNATLCPDCRQEASQASILPPRRSARSLLVSPPRPLHKRGYKAALVGALAAAAVAGAFIWFNPVGPPAPAPQAALAVAANPQAAAAAPAPTPAAPQAIGQEAPQPSQAAPTAPAPSPAAPAPGQPLARALEDGPVKPLGGPMEPESDSNRYRPWPPPEPKPSPAPAKREAAAKPRPAGLATIAPTKPPAEPAAEPAAEPTRPKATARATARPVVKPLRISPAPPKLVKLPNPAGLPEPAATPPPAPDRARLWRAMSQPAANAQAEKLLLAETLANPANLGARRNLALLHLENGRYREAVTQLKTILSMNPGDQEAKNLLNLIEVIRKP